MSEVSGVSATAVQSGVVESAQLKPLWLGWRDAPQWMREVVAGVAVAAGWIFAGVLLGAVWGLLAPARQYKVNADGYGVAIPGDSVHIFDGVMWFVGLSAALGVVGASLTWQWRSVRGPIVVAAALLASAEAARDMMSVGELVADWKYPSDLNAQVGSTVSVATGLGTMWALIALPMIAALIFFSLSGFSRRADLGVDDSTRQPVAGQAASGPAPVVTGDAGLTNVTPGAAPQIRP